jgi:Protein of unknown function (DUF4038)
MALGQGGLLKSRILLSLIFILLGVFGIAEAPQAGSKPANNLGPIIVSANGHFLQHKDGRPFFWLGDTAWNFFQRLDREETEHYLENRRLKGFNVIQVVTFHGGGKKNAYGSEALLENNAGRPLGAFGKQECKFTGAE